MTAVGGQPQIKPPEGERNGAAGEGLADRGQRLREPPSSLSGVQWRWDGEARKMRRLRSSTVVLGGMGMLALTITSCGSEPDKRCVDPLSYEVLPSYKCDDSSGSSSSSSSSSSSGRYYYGGSHSGSTVSGGSFDKSAVDRGGFGCSSSGSGGG
ncbi:hypothetical protein GCM10014713_60640 [Streptomyces purpureus]|uniref:Uncharacterized protein n=2 Tax=Streptomyces purpureus TaxID=1951 RepID=A0A918HGC4_9ACTN|nr:hypothetical protein GCM10014713_60640 [Streptomyces purpureus]